MATKKLVAPVRRDAVENRTPTQWGRRLARLVGEKFGVQMTANLAKNEGTFKGRDLVIKCAKSSMPPVSVLIEMLERIDELWAVYLTDDGGAEIWRVPAKALRQHGYFTHGANVQHRVEIYKRKIILIGELIGTLSEAEVESCDIP